MSDTPDWLPKLLLLEDYNNRWERYLDEVFSVFYRDFIETQPQFQNKWVRCRRDLIKGKEAAFWHCISKEPNENNRTPDIRRCERIGWVRAIIEHSLSSKVDCWPVRKKREVRKLLWFNEGYLVVLAERHRKRDDFQYMQLITTYCTEKERRKEKLRKSRDELINRING